MKRDTRMVAFGITAESNAAEMQGTLKSFGYDDAFTVSSVRELPPKFVKMIAPESEYK